MKKLFIILIFVCVAHEFYVNANELNPSEIIQLVEDKNIQELIHVFDVQKSLSIKESKRFLKDIIAIIGHRYSMLQMPSVNKLKDMVMIIIREYDISLSLSLQSEIEWCFSLLTDDFMLYRQQNVNLFHTIYNQPLPLEYRLIKCKSSKKDDKIESNQEIPDGIVIGLVETMCGAILWVTPFRNIGTGMMVDGIRRILNSAEETSKTTKTNVLQS